MKKFAAPKWESNEIGTAAYKNLIEAPGISKRSKLRQIKNKAIEKKKKIQNKQAKEGSLHKMLLSETPLKPKHNKRNKSKSKQIIEEVGKYVKAQTKAILETKDNKKKKNKKKKTSNIVANNAESSQPTPLNSSIDGRKKGNFKRKLNTLLKESKMVSKIKLPKLTVGVKKPKVVKSLREKMVDKLKGARFRFLNEQIYSTEGKDAQKLFKTDPDAFGAYHDGYRQQVNKWPVNPLDIIIKSVKKMPKSHIIADFGCGEGRLAQSVDQKVHSFDLVAKNELITACDMSHVPLEKETVDVVIFCLSLMGTNLRDYIFEANRVLKVGGVLKIAEVESRIENVENFIKGIQACGFKSTWKDLSHNLFYFIDFKKTTNVKSKNKLPTLSLLPCLYKKR